MVTDDERARIEAAWEDRWDGPPEEMFDAIEEVFAARIAAVVAAYDKYRTGSLDSDVNNLIMAAGALYHRTKGTADEPR